MYSIKHMTLLCGKGDMQVLFTNRPYIVEESINNAVLEKCMCTIINILLMDFMRIIFYYTF